VRELCGEFVKYREDPLSKEQRHDYPSRDGDEEIRHIKKTLRVLRIKVPLAKEKYRSSKKKAQRKTIGQSLTRYRGEHERSRLAYNLRPEVGSYKLASSCGQDVIHEKSEHKDSKGREKRE
jgi:hypothetical protein